MIERNLPHQQLALPVASLEILAAILRTGVRQDGDVPLLKEVAFNVQDGEDLMRHYAGVFFPAADPLMKALLDEGAGFILDDTSTRLHVASFTMPVSVGVLVTALHQGDLKCARTKGTREGLLFTDPVDRTSYQMAALRTAIPGASLACWIQVARFCEALSGLPILNSHMEAIYDKVFPAMQISELCPVFSDGEVVLVYQMHLGEVSDLTPPILPDHETAPLASKDLEWLDYESLLSQADAMCKDRGAIIGQLGLSFVDVAFLLSASARQEDASE